MDKLNKLNKRFIDGQLLEVTDLQPLADKIDELVDSTNKDLESLKQLSDQLKSTSSTANSNATDIRSIKSRINDLTSKINSNSREIELLKKRVEIVVLSEESLDSLSAEDALEGFLYCGIEDGGADSTWHFGDRFPIRFA